MSSGTLAGESWVSGASATSKNVVCMLIAEFQKQMKVASKRSSVASVGQDVTAMSTAAQRLARASTGGGRPRAPSMIMADAAVRELAVAREDRAKRDRSFMLDSGKNDKLQQFLATLGESSGADAASKLVESESRTRRSKSVSKPLHLKGAERHRSQSVSTHGGSPAPSSAAGLGRISEKGGQRARVGSVSRRRSGSTSSANGSAVSGGGGTGTPRSRKSRSDSRLSQVSTPSPRR